MIFGGGDKGQQALCPSPKPPPPIPYAERLGHGKPCPSLLFLGHALPLQSRSQWGKDFELSVGATRRVALYLWFSIKTSDTNSPSNVYFS